MQVLIQTESQHLLKPVPTAGIGNTKHWYEEYQPLVQTIPSLGTSNTGRWYERYQALEREFFPGIYSKG